MSSELKPIKIWGQFGPNPPKVTMLAAELNLPREHVAISLTEIKEPPYLAINPNGRIPAIYDPNTDITLWETGAIFEYLLEKYDKERKLSFEPGTPESFHAKQWLYFQVSGQGPYYGQAIWFKRLHPERVQSAVDRYLGEIKRVTGVLETHLTKEKEKGGDGPWLVGGRYSFADLAFFSWQNVVMGLLEKEEFDPDEFPIVKGWMERMKARKAISEVLESQAAAGKPS